MQVPQTKTVLMLASRRDDSELWDLPLIESAARGYIYEVGYEEPYALRLLCPEAFESFRTGHSLTVACTIRSFLDRLPQALFAAALREIRRGRGLSGVEEAAEALLKFVRAAADEAEQNGSGTVVVCACE